MHAGEIRILAAAEKFSLLKNTFSIYVAVKISGGLDSYISNVIIRFTDVNICTLLNMLVDMFYNCIRISEFNKKNNRYLLVHNKYVL